MRECEEKPIKATRYSLATDTWDNGAKAARRYRPLPCSVMDPSVIDMYRVSSVPVWDGEKWVPAKDYISMMEGAKPSSDVHG